MSRFKFGEIRADVNRLGPVPENPRLEAYVVRLTAPESDTWIESTLVSEARERSSGSDFFLASALLFNLEFAAKNPQLWMATTKGIRDVSPEEMQATLEVAKRLEPYLEQATRDAHRRFPLYSEHREGNIGPLELGIARQLQLPEHIGLAEEIADFFAYLYLVDRAAFHPDDDFNTYVDRAGKRTYSVPEAELRNALMVEAFQAADAEGLDIYELGLWVQGLIYGDKELAKDAPKWLVEQSRTWV